jgi:hypothetical protein
MITKSGLPVAILTTNAVDRTRFEGNMADPSGLKTINDLSGLLSGRDTSSYAESLDKASPRGAFPATVAAGRKIGTD